MINYILHLFLLVIAYSLAYSDGYLSGRGINLPWTADFGLWIAFFVIIILYGVTDK